MSRADRETGKIQDGPDTVFRCFAASGEARSPSLRKAVWHNFDLIKDSLSNSWRYNKDKVEQLKNLILNSLPVCDIVRVHVGGDYFSKDYLMAWVEVAKAKPEVVFYSYSKSLTFFKDVELPKNLILTGSRGGRFDDMIDELGWKEAVVVYSEDEAADLGLEIDHDDEHAAFGSQNFGLLIHGTQPKGSAASQALQAIKKLAKAA